MIQVKLSDFLSNDYSCYEITKMYTCVMRFPVKLTEIRVLEYGMGCGAC